MARPSLLGAAAAIAVLSLAACSDESQLRAGLVTPAEIHAFYVSHPALFEGRRLYTFREVGQGEPFTHAAEDLPLALLPRLARMQPGELVSLTSPEGALVWQLIESKNAPLSESEAAPAIEQLLAGAKRAAVARYEVRS